MAPTMRSWSAGGLQADADQGGPAATQWPAYSDQGRLSA